MGKRNKEERERKRKRHGLYVVVEKVGGGDVTVILATPTHILQPLPQWKKCFSATCNYYRLQIGLRSIGGARQNVTEVMCGVLRVVASHAAFIFISLSSVVFKMFKMIFKMILQCYNVLMTCL